MTFPLKSTNENGDISILNLHSIPDHCPVCNLSIKPKYKNGYHHRYSAQFIFQCPSNDCRSFFIANYNNNVSNYYSLVSLKPSDPAGELFSEEIEIVSEKFCEIYDQSSKAEEMGWNQIAGTGYRKALEFLIKDYCISIEKDEKIQDEIKGKWLGKVIEEHIHNENIKSTAKFAAWLGNDNTHYVKLWKDMDMENLKELIELTVGWIEMEERTRKIKIKMGQ